MGGHKKLTDEVGAPVADNESAITATPHTGGGSPRRRDPTRAR